MQDGCKVYMRSYMASNGSCFMVSWIIFKNHLLKVSLTQNQKTMALRTYSQPLIYFILSRVRNFGKAFGWGPGHIWLHITLEGPWPHHMILEVCWDGLWTLSFRLLACVWSGPHSSLNPNATSFYKSFLSWLEWSLSPCVWVATTPRRHTTIGRTSNRRG